MDGAPYRTFGLSNEPGTLGLSCNKQGLALAGVPLLLHAAHGFAPRSPAEIARLLSAAYDIEADVTSVIAGLGVVAKALNGGDTVRAMIAAAQLKLPALDWDGAVRIARAEEALQKYSPNQPRDWHGRWTTGGAGGPAIKPQPVSFRPSGQSAEAPPSATRQSDDVAADDRSAFEPPKDWVTLPPGKRIDELGDLLEWIANAKPEEEQAIRAEIKRYYYDVGDIQGGNALNLALSEALQDGPLSPKEKQEFLKAYEPYTRADPAEIGQMFRDLVTLGILSLPAAAVEAAAEETASVGTTAEEGVEAEIAATQAAPEGVWRLGWAARGRVIERAFGANLPPNFEVIDRFIDGIATSIKSLDLTAATYQDPARLLSRINRYVDQLANFKGARLGPFNLEERDIVTRELRLVVPGNVTTPAQRAALARAVERAKNLGVDLDITPY
jgi:hypothetical protein